jgi:hypothetical protein
METDLRDKRDDMRTSLVAVMKQQVAAYEAEHGEIKPAPPHVRLSDRPSRRQQMAYMKMLLLQAQRQDED